MKKASPCWHLSFNTDQHTFLSCDVPWRKSQCEQSAAFLRLDWPTISRSVCALCGSRQGLVGGSVGEEGVYIQPPQQFYFCELAACLCSSFLILSSSLGSSDISPVFIKVSLPFYPGTSTGSTAPSVETMTSVMDLLGTRWEAGAHDVRWAGCVFTSWLAPLRELCRGVWRQSACVCEVSVWMETEAPCFPPTHSLHILTKETHSLGQTEADSAEDRPSCTPFIAPYLSLPSFLPLSTFCHLPTVFGGGLHKSWTAFPPGKRGSLIEKEIRNENSHSYSGLCSVKARKCTRGKKTKCTGESLREIGHVLKTIWKKGSLTCRLSLQHL